MKRLTLAALVLAAACGGSSDKPGRTATTFRLTQMVNAVAGVGVSFKVAAVETSGAVITSYHGTVEFATDDTQSTAPRDVTFSPGDGGQITATVVFKTAGPRTFVVVDKAAPSAIGIAHVTVEPAAAARLSLSGLPATVVAGQPVALGVTTFDPYDNVATGFASVVHFASADAKARLPPDSTFSAADVGSRSFEVALTKAGTSSVTVSSAGLAPATAQVAVIPAQAANVTLEGLPAQLAVDVIQNITVTVRDGFGNPATDYAGTLRFTNSDRRAPSIPDATFSPADLGVRVVAVQFATAGQQTLAANDIATPSIATSLPALTQVVHGPAASLVVTGIPPSTVAGVPITALVTAVDNHGNVVTDFAGTVHFASTDPKAALPGVNGDVVFTPADLGARAFPVVLVSATASSVIIVSSAGLPVATTGVAVLHAGAALVTFEGLPGQVAIDAVQNVTVRVRDAFKNLVTEYAGTLHFDNTDNQASPIADTTFGPADLGTKVITVKFGTAGTRRVTATDTLDPSITGFVETQVIHGAAGALLLTGLPASTKAGATLSATVIAVDSHGNVVTDFSGTVHVSSTDPNAALNRDFVLTPPDSGSHTFLVVFTKAGNSSLTVSSPGFAPATVNVLVGPAAASQVTLEGLLSPVTVDVSLNVTATVRDAFGNPVTDYTGTLQFTSSDHQAILVPDTATFAGTDLGAKVVAVQFGTAGQQSLFARDAATPSIAGSASTVVLHGAAARLLLAGIPASTVAGTQLAATVTAVDNHGNFVTDFTGTVQFASSDPGAQLPTDFTFAAPNPGTRTFLVVLTKAATSTVTVSSPGLPSATATATVVVGPAGGARVTLEGLPGQVVVDVPQNLTVTVRDRFGNAATDYAGTLHFTIDDPQVPPLPDTKFVPADLGVKVVAVTFATAGLRTVSATDAVTPSITGLASTQVVHGPAARLTLAGIPASTVAGTFLIATVTAVDGHANRVTDFSGTVHFDSTDSNAQLPADYVFTPADSGSHQLTVMLARAGTSSVTISSAGLQGASATVAVRNAAATQLTLEGLLPQVVVDAVQSVTVTARDAFGNPAPDYTGTVRFASSDPQASSISDAAFTPLDSGVKVVNVQFGTAGRQTLSAADLGKSTIAGSASTLVLHGPAARLAIAGILPTTVAGALLTGTVRAVDNQGNVVTDFVGTMHFTSTDPVATLPPDFTFGAADNGIRSFSAALMTAGQRSISVSQLGGTAAGATVTVSVTNAPASRITFDAHAAQVAVDTNAVFTVTVRDRFGNPALDYTGTVHFVPSDLAVTPILDVTFTPAMFATVDVTVQFATAGQQSLVATDTSNPSITGSVSILVIHGPAASLALSGVPASAVAGTALTPTVRVFDSHGNLVTDFTATVHVTSSDPNAQLPADFAFKATDLGARTFPVVLTSAASSSITVASAGLAPATATVVVRNAPATQLTLEGLPAQVVAGVSQNVSVIARDAFRNPAIDYAGTVHFTSTDPQPRVPDATFVTGDLGVRIVAVQFGTAGPQTLTATDTVTPSIAGSASTLVKAGPGTRLVLSPFPATAVAGTAFTSTVTAFDSRGNTATDFVGTVHFTSTDLTAQLPADFTYKPADLGSHGFSVVLFKAGTSSVTVSSPNVTGDSASVPVRNAPASQLTLEGLPAQVVVDQLQSFTIRARDSFGNPATDYIGIIHFTSSDVQASLPLDTSLAATDLGAKSVSVRFATAGAQTVTATDTVRSSITGSATTLVLHGPAVSLTLAGIGGTPVAGTLLTATVTVLDGHGNVVTDFAGTVHFSSTDPSAQLPPDVTFTTPNPGTGAFSVVLKKAGTSSVTVSSTGLVSATASVTVRNAPASQLTLEGLPVQVVVDQLQSFTVRARDSFGNPATDYTGTIHFTSSDARASLPPDTTFAATDLGTKAVSVRFATAGTQTLSATDTVRPTAGSATILVLHGPAVSLSLTGIPGTTVAGQLLTATVTALDGHGNVVTDFAGTVHFSSNDPNASLPADTPFAVTDGGVQRFPVALTTAGARSVSVSQVGATSVAGATANVTVSNAAASRITLDAHAAQVAVDSNAVFTVTVRDRFGNPALDYRGTVHFIPSDQRATTITDVTFTAAMSATSDVTLQFATAGDQSLIATDTANPAITGSTVIKVTNGPAAAYALSALPSGAVAGEPLPLTITATDAHGNTVLNYGGSAAVTSTDPSDRLPAPGSFIGGVRSVSLAFVTAGLHHATVSEVGGLIRADTSVVNIVSGNASILVLTDASTIAGTPASTKVVAKDAFGNVVGSYRGTVALTSTDPQAVLPAPYTFVQADAGQHALSVTLKTAGTWSVIATDAASSISGSATFAVTPAAGASCDLGVIGKAGAQVAVRVRVSDAFANLATGYTGTMTFSSSDAQATLPPSATYIAADRGSRDFTAVLPTPGDQSIRATDSATLFSCQANVSIVTAQFFAVTFTGSESWAGTPRPATVQAQDANGTPITTYKGTIVFSSSDSAATLPGNVTLTGTEGGKATVNVTFKTIGLQTFAAKDSADATKTGTAFQLVHGLVYTDPPIGGKVRLILNAAASTSSVVQLDLVSNASLFTLGISDPLSTFGTVLPSSVRNGAFAVGMNLPLDASKAGPDAQLLVLAPPATAVLTLGGSPQAVGAALANGVLYSGISQKRFDRTLNCTSCTNDHLRGDALVHPFPLPNSLYYSLRLKLTPNAAPGAVFDGQALASNARFRAAVRDRSGSDVFSGTADFAIGKLEVK